MKKFILEYKRYSQICLRQLLRSMQPFVHEDHLDILCSEDEIELELINQELARDEFITSMLRTHQANSSRKRRLMIKNAKIEKSDLTLSTYVQYVEDFKFCANVAGKLHRLRKKKLQNGL